MVKGTKKNNSGKSRRFHDIKEGDCIFPFIYNGKVFDECIPDTRGGKYNGKRCATEVDDIGNLVKWGYCPKEKTKKKSPKAKTFPTKSKTKKTPPKTKKKKVSPSKTSLPSVVNLDELRLPKWYDNSCFLDSVLVCLLLRPNPYLINRLLNKPLIPYVLAPGDNTEEELRTRTMSLNGSCSVEARENIREQLRNIFQYIHNNIDNDKLIDRKSRTGTVLPRRVRNFRESLSECVLPTYESFTGSGIAEANEFLKYILSMFPDEDSPNLVEQVFYTNDVTTEINSIDDIINLEGDTCTEGENLQTTDVYFFVSPSDLYNAGEETNLSEFLESKEDSIVSEGSDYLCNEEKYLRAIKFRKFQEERYIIFDLSRTIGGEFLDVNIVPDEEIELSNGKKFKFVSAVYRIPGMTGTHFTSYVLVNDVWHFYNDNPSGREPIFEEVGDYDDLLEYSDEEIKNCVMYFYEPL